MLQGLFQLAFALEQPGIEPHKEPLLIGADALGEILLHRGGAQQGALLLDPLGSPAEGVLQVFGGQVQLDEVIHHADPHGLLDVIEFFKAGQHDKGGQGPLLPAGARQGQAVHDRHFYIRDDDVGLFPLDQVQCKLAVAGSPADGIAQLFPFQHPLQADEHQRLIINQ